MKLARPCLPIDHTWDGVSIPEAEVARVGLSRQDEVLVIEVDAPFHGDPPPPGPADSTDGLWNYEVVEVFVAEQDPGDRPLRYTEIELSPHGHYLVLQLEGVRTVVASGLPLAYEVSIDGHRWRGRARVPLHVLPEGPWRGNSFGIHGLGLERRYLVHSSLPESFRGIAPDFHRPEAFVPFGL